MPLKVDPNKNDNTYNPEHGYAQKPADLPKSKRKRTNNRAGQ